MRRFFLLLAILIGVSAVVLLLWLNQRDVAGGSEFEVRAIWVSRYEYDTEEDVRHIVSNLIEAGFTDLFFQIRANGTAYYRSELEPWAFELSGKQVVRLGTDPGWDPLRVAIDCAAGSPLRIHAYMNVLPGWKGVEDPPEEQHQLWTEHPDWFMVDVLGEKMLPTPGWYAFVNPVLPEVREHLRGIVRELCQYKVAGIHLDYLRYPHDYRDVAARRYPDCSEEELLQHSDFSYDAASMGELYALFGGDVTEEEIREFRCDSVSRVVEELAFVVENERPGDCPAQFAV